MSKEQDYSQEHNATIRRWEREEERRKMSAEHIRDEAKKTISNMLKNQETKAKVAKDLKNATENRPKTRYESGFGSHEGDEGPITGYDEQSRPWERD